MSTAAPRHVTVPLGAVFLLSGAVALLWEAAWQRAFALLFGSSAPATAAVLAAYFAGLGIGSALLGRLAARGRHPLRVYACLELIIAAGALLVSPLLSLYAGFYPALFDRFDGGGAMFLTIKCLLAFAAIALPTVAMGGTLPVLAQLFDGQRATLGEKAGWLYMLNTAGAAAGVLAFPWLLGVLGMRHTAWLGAGLHVAIAAAAFLLAGRYPVSATAPPAVKDRAAGVWKWTGLAFASGFVTFVLQIGWNRAFAQVHANAMHSFTLLTALFIAAVAVGAQGSRLMLRRGWPRTKCLAITWLAGGVLTLIAPAIFVRGTDGLQFAGDAAWSPALSVLAAGCVFLPVALLATALPLILQEVADSPRSAGEVSGRVLAWNIAGAVTGALAGGFVLPALAGLWGTFFLTAALVMALASLLLTKSLPARLGVAGGCLAIGLLALLAELPVTQIAAREYEKLLAVRQGAHGIAAVVERPGSRRLKLNNHYLLGGNSSIGDERMQAHLPLLLHPAPKRIAFLGYGTGITAGGALFHGPEQLTALELVPEVADLAGEYFAAENMNFTAQPGVRLLKEDARNFLRGTAETFDVIIGDLVVPWRQGEGALYTREHFAAARNRLAPGGLSCAWLPLFQLSADELDGILATFLEVFPNATLWRGDFSPAEPALAVIGGDWTPETVAARAAKMRSDPLNPHLAHPPAVWMYFLGRLSLHDCGPGPNTENNPWIELQSRRGPPFTGRSFHEWAEAMRTQPLRAYSDEVRTGMESGRLMSEWTLLMSERREREAQDVMRKLREVLGAELARVIFGE
jgi:spermidine synthase